MRLADLMAVGLSRRIEGADGTVGAGRGTAPARGRTAARARPDLRGLPTERKYVTLLRADLARSTDLVADLELEEALERLAPALVAMRAAVHAFGGVVVKEMGDGLFGAFGAPIAEDLHAVMACHAGLDLVRRIRGLGDAALHVRVGVHSGQVVAGVAETDFSRAYDLGGPPLIMAERLQAAAGLDQVLASGTARSLAEGYIRFGAALQLELKGFARPITAHVVEGVAELSKWRVSLARGTAAFVGRTAEQAQLADLAATVAATGQGARAALLGEPGVGKSRLAHEALAALEHDGWQVIEAECSPILGRTPFALLKDLLRAAQRAVGEEGFAALRAALPAAPAVALGVTLDGALPSHAWTALTPRARGRAIAEAARAVFAAALTDRRTALLVEDLQWADEASVPAVEAIATLAAEHRLLLLVTARTGGMPAWFAAHDPLVLPLQPLEQASGMAMLDHLLGPSPRLAALKRRILEHTGALPLFVEEVCRGLVEEGALSGTWGAFEPATRSAELGVPPTVQGVIASRIDRLAPPEKRLLQVAAVCGPRVPSRLLEVVSGLKETVFRSALGALLGASMLVPAETAAEPVHGFPHELVRQVAYDAVLGPEKAALHAQILAELEAQLASGRAGPDLAGALVHHAMMAREWSRAADYAAQVARECLARSALPDATRYFETAMEAVDRLEESPAREARAVDLRIEARLAYANHGQLERWLELAGEAERRAEKMGDLQRRVAALAMRAAALNFVGPALEAIEAGRAAVAAATACSDRSSEAYALYGLGQALYHGGRFREAAEILELAYRRFAVEKVPPPPGAAPLHLSLLSGMMLSICYSAVGDIARAEAAQEAADALAQAAGRPYDFVAAGLSRGILAFSRGEPDTALAILENARSDAERGEIQIFLGILRFFSGVVANQTGRTELARQLLHDAVAHGEEFGHRTVLLRGTIHASLAGAPGAAALERVQRVKLASRQEGYAAIELEAMQVEAKLYARLGDAAAADACTQTTQAYARALGLENARLGLADWQKVSSR